MIIVKIIGGLGNQMFQYALGRSLAYRHNTELKLDISDYQELYKLHRYGLHHLNIHASIASPKEINQLKNGGKQRILLALLKIFRGNTAKSYLAEKKFSFDPSILSCGDNVYFNGYWQSEKYFTNVQDIIKEEFKIKTSPDQDNDAMIKRIESTEAVAVHIARGDYISNSKTNSVHGSASLEYYTKAAKIIMDAINTPTFFVFSDDLQWVKKNLNLPSSMIFVDYNGPEKNYEDLRLMSLCKHHIIANSTLSWWGAWLAEHKDQKVIAPLRWFNNDVNTKDLIPDRWERI